MDLAAAPHAPAAAASASTTAGEPGTPLGAAAVVAPPTVAPRSATPTRERPGDTTEGTPFAKRPATTLTTTISPSKPTPEYPKVEFKFEDFTKELLKLDATPATPQQLTNAITESIRATAKGVVELARVVNSHADHFHKHHEAIAKTIQQVRIGIQDSRNFRETFSTHDGALRELDSRINILRNDTAKLEDAIGEREKDKVKLTGVACVYKRERERERER